MRSNIALESNEDGTVTIHSSFENYIKGVSTNDPTVVLTMMLDGMVEAHNRIALINRANS